MRSSAPTYSECRREKRRFGKDLGKNVLIRVNSFKTLLCFPWHYDSISAAWGSITGSSG